MELAEVRTMEAMMLPMLPLALPPLSPMPFQDAVILISMTFSQNYKPIRV